MSSGPSSPASAAARAATSNDAGVAAVGVAMAMPPWPACSPASGVAATVPGSAVSGSGVSQESWARSALMFSPA